VLRGASVTAERYKVGSVLCVQDKDMKQAWCLVSLADEFSPKVGCENSPLRFVSGSWRG
jgi:hypothetical protein